MEFLTSVTEKWCARAGNQTRIIAEMSTSGDFRSRINPAPGTENRFHIIFFIYYFPPKNLKKCFCFFVYNSLISLTSFHKKAIQIMFKPLVSRNSYLFLQSILSFGFILTWRSISESIEWFIVDQLLTVVWFSSSPIPCPPLPSVIKFDPRQTGRQKKRQLAGKGRGDEGVRGGKGAKSYNGEKAWSSINKKSVTKLLSPPPSLVSHVELKTKQEKVEKFACNICTHLTF